MSEGCKDCGDNPITRGIRQLADTVKSAATNKSRFGIKERKAKDRRDG